MDREKHISTNPSSRIKGLKFSQKLAFVLTENQLANLFQYLIQRLAMALGIERFWN